VGETESSEFRRQSRLIAERWGAAIRTDTYVIPGANHFTAPEALAEADSTHVATLVAMCKG
jgi:hypothetical protein